MDEATMERAKAAMIGEDEAKEIGRNALHGARVLIDRANATGIEERRDEYQEHAADLMVTADLARTVLVLYADLARIRAEHAAALDAARREGAEGMLARCRTAALDAFMAHPLTMDPRHEPGCICHAIARGSCSECDRGDAIMAALAALPLDAPGGGS